MSIIFQQNMFHFRMIFLLMMQARLEILFHSNSLPRCLLWVVVDDVAGPKTVDWARNCHKRSIDKFWNWPVGGGSSDSHFFPENFAASGDLHVDSVRFVGLDNDQQTGHWIL